jgi:hypothetical protein
MPAKLNFFKTPASEQLVSSRPVSTSTGISGCFQPGQAKVGPGPTPLVPSPHRLFKNSRLTTSSGIMYSTRRAFSKLAILPKITEFLLFRWCRMITVFFTKMILFFLLMIPRELTSVYPSPLSLLVPNSVHVHSSYVIVQKPLRTGGLGYLYSLYPAHTR